MIKVGVILGTRPEALKLIPVIVALKDFEGQIETHVISTGQHKELLEQVLNLFGVDVDYNLNVMQNNQTLKDLSVSILDKSTDTLSKLKLDRVIVQGDTTSAFIASLASMYLKIPVCHVEAGLRSYNRSFPWPEEFNRRAVALIADLHFAPTKQAKENLLSEKVEGDIVVTGNTVIDMLFLGIEKISSDIELTKKLDSKFDFIGSKKLILITCHRREYFDGFGNICDAIVKLSKKDDTCIIFSVHPNPNIHNVAHERLSGINNVFLLPPQNYLEFIYLMNRAEVILSDSGGIQEEAPYLGKRVLVLRNETERPEAISTGYVKLVGNDKNNIYKSVSEYLSCENELGKPDISSLPFGDGTAGKQIVRAIRGCYGL
jgi:UDP-N-acetylglucosamine 2-epimerase (non-hydrolysing)